MILLPLKNASTDVVLTSPTTTTLPPPSNEGYGHCMLTLKCLCQACSGRKEHSRLSVRAEYIDSLNATDEASLLAP